MTWPCRRTRRMTRSHLRRERAIHAYAAELAQRSDEPESAAECKQALVARVKAHANQRGREYDRIRRDKLSSADVAAREGAHYEATETES